MKDKEILTNLKDPILSSTALTVLEKRYLIKDENGKVIETPKELFWRVAKHVASAEYIYNGFTDGEDSVFIDGDIERMKIYDEVKKKVHETAISFYEMMSSLSLVPNTPCLTNAGRPLGQLSACFTVDMQDSMDSIFEAVKKCALVHKSGGGTGIDFSTLRPKDDLVKSTTGTSSGVVSFMTVFNAATEVVKQGSTRRGASIGILRCDHPDILDFINCKNDTTKLNNFNISIAITDEFMNAVKDNKEYWLINPRNGEKHKKLKARDVFNQITKNAWRTGEPGVIFIDTINKYNTLIDMEKISCTNPCLSGDCVILTENGNEFIRNLDGKEIKIINLDGKISSAKIWKTGKKKVIECLTKGGLSFTCTPDHTWKVDDEKFVEAKDLIGKHLRVCGILNEKFITGYNENTEVVAIRDAGEEDVYDFTEPITHGGFVNGFACHNCGEIPLLKWESCNLMAINLNNILDDKNRIDWDKLKELVRVGVHFLDNMIDVNKYPLIEIEDKTKSNRKIGLGMMGLADMLVKRGIKYDSNECLELIDKLVKFIYNNAKEKSMELAEQRGSFPNFSKSVFSKDKKIKGMRNATLLTCAPNGSTGMIANASSGIEPLFGIAYTKTVMDGKSFHEFHPYFKYLMSDIHKIWSDELEKKIISEGSIQNIKDIPEDVRKVFVTAHDISPEWHVKVQAALQKNIDNSVSKTVNCPKKSTVEDIEKIYVMAWESGLKGLTVYRDGSRDNQVLTIGKEEPIKKEEDKPIIRTRKRPKITKGETHEIAIGCGEMLVTVNEDDKGVCEVIVQLGKSGGCAQSHCEAIGRIVSIALRSNVQIEKIIKQLSGIRCPSPSMGVGGSVLSCADAISKILVDYMKSKKKEMIQEKKSKAEMGSSPECPSCGAMMVFSEGCGHCQSCGYSRCG